MSTTSPHASCDGWFTARVTTCGEFDQALKATEQGNAGAYIEVVTDKYAASPLSMKLHESVKTSTTREFDSFGTGVTAKPGNETDGEGKERQDDRHSELNRWRKRLSPHPGLKAEYKPLVEKTRSYGFAL